MKTNRKKYFTKYDRWFGIYGLQFIWHGEWGDPEVRWHNYIFDANDIEEPMYELFRQEIEDGNIVIATPAKHCAYIEDSEEWGEAFTKFMRKNKREIRECIYNAINAGQYERIRR